MSYCFVDSVLRVSSTVSVLSYSIMEFEHRMSLLNQNPLFRTGDSLIML
jgi:hypothetical protein